MSVKIASWNIARGLSDPERLASITAGLQEMDADVVILSESMDKEGRLADPDFAKKLGYAAITTEYEDVEPHPSEQQFLTVLYRQSPGVDIDTVRLGLGTRRALGVLVRHEGTAMLGIASHFDDRSEDKRIAMVNALVEGIGKDERDWEYVFVAGDLNAMHPQDWRAKILGNRTAQIIARHIPESIKKLARFKSLATRLTEMAKGTTMRLFSDLGFVDADPRRQATMLLAGKPAVQLDHILHTPDLDAKRFKAHTFAGSDHRAISVTLQPARTYNYSPRP